MPFDLLQFGVVFRLWRGWRVWLSVAVAGWRLGRGRERIAIAADRDGAALTRLAREERRADEAAACEGSNFDLPCRYDLREGSLDLL